MTISIVSEGTINYIPNASAKAMKISYSATGTTNPGYGGFYLAFNNITSNGVVAANRKYREGQRIVHKIYASIPSGRNIDFHTNAYGTNGFFTWLTSQAGTGDWEEYVAIQQIGKGGSLAETGFYAISGGSNTAFDWYVAECTIIDLDAPAEVRHSSGLSIGYDTEYNSVIAGFGGLGVTGSALIKGNVGIGTNTPTAKLHIASNNGTDGTLFQRWDYANSPGVYELQLKQTVTSGVVRYNFSMINAGTTYNDVLVLDRGNVGIGTTTPGEKLHIAKDGYNFRISNAVNTNGYNIGRNTTNGLLYFYGDQTGFTGYSFGGIDGVRMTITSSGNVGIGTETPATKLHVSGSTISTSFTDPSYYRIVNPGGASYVTTAATVTGALRIKLPLLGSYGMIQMTVKIYQYSTGQSTTLVIGGYSYYDVGTVTYLWANVFAYQMGDTFRDINVRFGNDGGADCIWIGETTDVWDYPQVFVTDVQVGFVGHTTNWLTNWSISYETVFNAVITVRIARRPANSGYSTETLATVTARGNISTADVIINGNLTVGQSTATYIYMTDTDHTTRAIHCNSNRIGFLTFAGGWGSWCDNSGNWASIGDVYAYFSDERLKKKVGKIENALEKIMSLNGFKYVNNDIAKKYGYTSDDVQIGISAQEVQKILPEIVSIAPFDLKEGEDNTSKSGEDYLTVNYAKLIPVLIEAMKEQQEEIEKLKKIINNGSYL